MSEQVAVTDNNGDLNAEYADLEPDAAADLASGRSANDADAQVESLPDHSEEKEEYSNRVQKRIGKEVSRRKRIAAERDVYKSQFEQTQAELIALREAEVERMRADAENLTKQAAAALDDGETETYAKLNSEMIDVKVKLAQSEMQKQHYPAPSAPDESSVSDAAQAWLAQNEWVDDDPQKLARAQRIENDLIRAGYSVDDEELYAELDARLGVAAADPASLPPQQSYANVPGRSTPANNAANKNRLSREDLRLMSQYGMNPHDTEHRKLWLEGKTGN